LKYDRCPPLLIADAVLSLMVAMDHILFVAMDQILFKDPLFRRV
jgi:hypothetical protein